MEVIKIESKNNKNVIKTSKLNNKKYRDKYSSYIIEGKKLIKEAILYNPSNITEIYISYDNYNDLEIKKILDDLNEKKSDVFVYLVSDEIISKISNQKTPEGIIGVLKKYEEKCIKEVIYNINLSDKNIKNILDRGRETETETEIVKEDDKAKKIVNINIIPVLYNISDPSNLGAIIRVIASLGIKSIITIGDNNVDKYSPKVLRSSMGGFFKVHIIHTNIDKIIENFGNNNNLKDLSNANNIIVCADMCGENLYSFSEKVQSGCNKNIIVIFGNEANGISDDILSKVSNTISIPMKDNTESLNLASSFSIILYELSRYRLSNM